MTKSLHHCIPTDFKRLPEFIELERLASSKTIALIIFTEFWNELTVESSQYGMPGYYDPVAMAPQFSTRLKKEWNAEWSENAVRWLVEAKIMSPSKTHSGAFHCQIFSALNPEPTWHHVLPAERVREMKVQLCKVVDSELGMHR